MATVGFFSSDFDPKAQLDTFNAAKCEHIYYDQHELLLSVERGDVVVLHDMYCAGKTLTEVLEFLGELAETEADFVCKSAELDSRTSADVYRTLGAVLKLAKAEPKRPAKRAPRAAASDGATTGAPSTGRRGRATVSPEAVDHAIELYQSGTNVKDVCAEVGLSQGTLYKYLRERGISRK